jgi:hypothetical protein
MAFESKDQYYLHFYKDEEKLFVKMDTDPTEGIPVRFDGAKDNRRLACNIVCSSKATIQYFTGVFDWPLSKERNSTVKYSLGKVVEPGIFELI